MEVCSIDATGGQTKEVISLFLSGTPVQEVQSSFVNKGLLRLVKKKAQDRLLFLCHKGKMLRPAPQSNRAKGVLCISSSDKPRESVRRGCVRRVRREGMASLMLYNLSISDLLMDSLIKNDSIDLVYNGNAKSG